ncbi:hypothetical protein FJU08_02805 [Martelella alba]|uniref:SPOR domain-containing protein n=1 Tax=Martelella alba TaxID=2590451 RepID=A0A506UJL8_9HYPH|nr:SPOR domain-containing protein [Martelella alba]TPW33505.1 hypothetical protein FJU08_02805 [Martelella alba]
MADKNNPDRSRGNFGDLSPDDPFAELARLIAPDDQPARTDAPSGQDDLADELLREFERVTTPGVAPDNGQPSQPAPPASSIPLQQPVSRPSETGPVETGSGFDDYSDDMLADELEMSMGQFDLPEPEAEPEPVSFVPDRSPFAAEPPHQAEPRFDQRPQSTFEQDLFAEPDYGRATPQEPATPRPADPLPVEEPAFAPQTVPQSPSYGGASFGEPGWRATVAAPVDVVHSPTQASRPQEPAAPVSEPAQPSPAAPAEARRHDELDLDLDELAKELSDFELDDLSMAEEPAGPEDPIEEAALSRDDVFDPAALVAPEELPQPVTEMDLPDLPEHDPEHERMAAPAYEYGLDDDLDDVLGAEHGLANPLRQQPREPQAQPPMAAAAAAGAARAGEAIYDDDIESVLEDDFRRALSQSEAMRRQRIGDTADHGGDHDDEEREFYFGPLRGVGQLVLAGLAFVGVVAVAVFLVYQFVFSGSTGNAPVVITADNSSVKEAPEDPGGEVVPNQDNPVFSRVTGERGSPPTQGNLISSDQSPVDLDTAAPNPIADLADGVSQADANSDMPAPDDTAADDGGAGTVDSSMGVATRKVRTIVVRPDGTLVERDASDGVGAADAAATVQPAAAPDAEQPVESQPADATTALEPAPVETGEPEAQPIDPNSVGFDLYNVPLPTPRSSTIAAASTAAATAPAASPVVAPAAPATSSATPAGSLSPYAVQVASLPSEADAKKAYTALAAKYPSIFGGRSVEYQAAEIDGKGTYYRVRIPASSLDAAISLCEALKAQGGSCLVPR